MYTVTKLTLDHNLIFLLKQFKGQACFQWLVNGVTQCIMVSSFLELTNSSCRVEHHRTKHFVLSSQFSSVESMYIACFQTGQPNEDLLYMFV